MSNNTNRVYRMRDEPYQRAQERAAAEGTTLTALVREFVTAYGQGRIPNRFGVHDCTEASGCYVDAFGVEHHKGGAHE